MQFHSLSLNSHKIDLVPVKNCHTKVLYHVGDVTILELSGFLTI